jgi:divalent metal cation (Fe/Co/Zn/Cd) transporter
MLSLTPARVRTPSPDTCTDDCCTPSLPERVPTAIDDRGGPAGHAGETDECCAPEPVRDAAWLRSARHAKVLAWASLTWMTLEGVLGLFTGIRAGSIGLVGWALSSVVEGLASVIVIWRFTGARTHSTHAEATAQRAVAVSFWLLAPYVGAQSVVDLIGGSHPATTSLGIALTISSIALMPALGIAKRRLGKHLDSGATAGEGAQNLLCAYLAAGVLAGLLANTTLGWWWLDPIAGLAVATIAVFDGRRAWRGEDCC